MTTPRSLEAAARRARPFPRSPGRAAAQMRLRGWRALMPFLYLTSGLLGLAGLVGSASGLALRGWLISVVTRLDPAAVRNPGTPGIVYAMLALSGALLVWGLAGIVRGEREERRREELLRRAESLHHRACRIEAAWPEERRLAG